MGNKKFKNLPRGFEKAEYNYLLKLIEGGEECSHCDNGVETLHHIDENQDNCNRSNLLPLCYSCHEEIPHRSDNKEEL